MVLKVFEELALDKLRTLQPCSLKKWAKALGYKSSQAFYYTQKKLLKAKRITRKKSGRIYLYRILEKDEKK